MLRMLMRLKTEKLSTTLTVGVVTSDKRGHHMSREMLLVTDMPGFKKSSHEKLHLVLVDILWFAVLTCSATSNDYDSLELFLCFVFLLMRTLCNLSCPINC
ncbi:hypothetical protein Bca4012_016619 [Brassica carinata]